MRCLWEQAPRTIMELTSALKAETGWSKNTVITMLSRLEHKGAIRYEAGERARQYYPAMERHQASCTETRSFLDKVYGGSLGLMIHTMADSGGLTEEEVAELSGILERAKEAGQ